jgi:ABC-2 type transport system permease protein
MRMTQDNYLVFLIVGVIPWVFFTNVVTSGCNCVWINGNIIKKVYFPREILPISVVGAGLVNFAISCIIILIFCLFSGIGFSINLLWLPAIAIVQCMLSLGMLFILSAINVYVRDIEYLVQFIMNLVFYATPIIYNVSIFPAKFRWVLYLNPLAHLIDAYRAIFYYKTMPNLASLGIVGLISFVVLVLGYLIFKRMEKGFAEEV